MSFRVVESARPYKLRRLIKALKRRRGDILDREDDEFIRVYVEIPDPEGAPGRSYRLPLTTISVGHSPVGSYIILRGNLVSDERHPFWNDSFV